MKEPEQMTDEELEKEIYIHSSVSERLSIKDEEKRRLSDEQFRRLEQLDKLIKERDKSQNKI